MQIATTGTKRKEKGNVVLTNRHSASQDKESDEREDSSAPKKKDIASTKQYRLEK